jgi:3-hydroxyisobutyrate dehydrogenase-like beta-hydroxyacid dehydrogenase
MAVFEAATLAAQLGLSLDALKAAMRANGQLGEMVETYLLLHEFSEEDFANPETRAVLASYATIIEKDLDLIVRLAESVGVDVPASQLAGRLARRVYFLEESST